MSGTEQQRSEAELLTGDEVLPARGVLADANLARALPRARRRAARCGHNIT